MKSGIISSSCHLHCCLTSFRASCFEARRVPYFSREINKNKKNMTGGTQTPLQGPTIHPLDFYSTDATTQVHLCNTQRYVRYIPCEQEIAARTLTGKKGAPTVLFEIGLHKIKASVFSDFVGLHDTYTCRSDWRYAQKEGRGGGTAYVSKYENTLLTGGTTIGSKRLLDCVKKTCVRWGMGKVSGTSTNTPRRRLCESGRRASCCRLLILTV